MSAHLYIEGGDSKEDQIRCREGFRKLLEKSGLAEQKRMPRLSACGGRNAAFDDFKTAHATRKPGDFIGLLVDSEIPVADVEETWAHLKTSDNWEKPESAADDQVLLMTTSMETWIVADLAALKEHYGHKLQESALPPLGNLEKRDRHDVHDGLVHATRNCPNPYRKGKRSFEVLRRLEPTALQILPSFQRALRILRQKCR